MLSIRSHISRRLILIAFLVMTMGFLSSSATNRVSASAVPLVTAFLTASNCTSVTVSGINNDGSLLDSGVGTIDGGEFAFIMLTHLRPHMWQLYQHLTENHHDTGNPHAVTAQVAFSSVGGNANGTIAGILSSYSITVSPLSLGGTLPGPGRYSINVFVSDDEPAILLNTNFTCTISGSGGTASSGVSGPRFHPTLCYEPSPARHQSMSQQEEFPFPRAKRSPPGSGFLSTACLGGKPVG